MTTAHGMTFLILVLFIFGALFLDSQLGVTTFFKQQGATV